MPTATGGDAIRRVRVRVPAKVNLFLSVRGEREDGYHELVTVFQTVGLHDTLVVSIDGPPLAYLHPSARRFVRIVFTHDAGPHVPADENNLVLQAAYRLMDTLGVGIDAEVDVDVDRKHVPVTRIHLEKHIPVQAGMAGGSADAAGALVALNRLWGGELGREELREIAADLGADVPFCVVGGTALATGTGTATAQVLTRGTYHWVIGTAPTSLATPDVYRAWDDLAISSDAEPDLVLHALRTGDAEALGAALHNDLQLAAFNLQPTLKISRDALLEAGALGAVVSGSGPTLVGLARDERDASRIAEEVSGFFDRVVLASSPAAGPDLHVEG